MNQPASEIPISDTIRFLQAGKQTQITPEIQLLAAKVSGATVRDKARSILSLTQSLQARGFDDKVFRKRTGAQIIQDGYVTGCTDSALAFVTLARANGIPTKYVETIDVKWLREGGGSIGGHIYAQVYNESQKKWLWVDPMENRVDIPAPQDRVMYKEGLDSWDIGITDFQSLQQAFESFRQNWIEQQKLKQ